MKIDRLLDIVIYLLNHKTATAKQLSERFQVSVRTIQRDVESIALAGVPIMATKGSGGGYQLMPAHQIRNQFLKQEDLELIVMALKSLDTGYDNARLKLVLDRYLQPERFFIVVPASFRGSSGREFPCRSVPVRQSILRRIGSAPHHAHSRVW